MITRVVASENGRVVKARDEKGRPICGAKRRKKDAICQIRPMVNGRCRIHGGTSLMGPAHPDYKHGRYSTWLPPALRDKVEEAVADPELLSLNAHIGLLDVRLGELLERVDAGTGQGHWARAAKAWQRYQEAAAAQRISSMRMALEDLGREIAAGQQDAVLWVEIVRTMEARRGMVDTERRRRVDMQLMVTAEEALGMMRALVESVRKYVRDPEVLRLVTGDFARLVGRGRAETK